MKKQREWYDFDLNPNHWYADEKPYNEYDGGGSLKMDDLTPEQQDVMSYIQANPEVLFTERYSKWRDYLRSTHPKYLDSLFESMPQEKQDTVHVRYPKAFGALSNEAKGKYGERSTRNKTNEVSPYFAAGLGATFAAPFVVESAIPMLGIWQPTALNPTTWLGRALTSKPATAYFGAQGLVNAASEDGIAKTKRLLSEGKYGRAGVSLLGDIADLWLAKNGIEAIDAMGKAGKACVELIRTLRNPQVPEGYTVIKPNIRTKIGDVEVDNPNLFYRQGTGLSEDFLNTGVVSAKSAPGEKIGRINLGKTFLDPMFSKGHRFYGDGWNEADLLVTADADKMKNIRQRTSLSKDIYIPKERGGLILDNTTAYSYEPNYGYRKANVDNGNVINLEDFIKQTKGRSFDPDSPMAVNPKFFPYFDDVAVSKASLPQYAQNPSRKNLINSQKIFNKRYNQRDWLERMEGRKLTDKEFEEKRKQYPTNQKVVEDADRKWEDSYVYNEEPNVAHVGKRGTYKPEIENTIITHERDHTYGLVDNPEMNAAVKRITMDGRLGSEYLQDPNELLVRAGQIDNWYGITNMREQPITGDMLKYAAYNGNYLKDAGFDNNMTDFFSVLKATDTWDLMAEMYNRFGKVLLPFGIFGTLNSNQNEKTERNNNK